MKWRDRSFPTRRAGNWLVACAMLLCFRSQPSLHHIRRPVDAAAPTEYVRLRGQAERSNWTSDPFSSASLQVSAAIPRTPVSSLAPPQITAIHAFLPPSRKHTTFGRNFLPKLSCGRPRRVVRWKCPPKQAPRRRRRPRARNLCRLPTVAANAVQPQWAWPGRSMRAMVRRVPPLVLQGNSLPWLLHGLRPPDAAAAAAAYTSKASSASGHRRLLFARKSTLYHCL